MHAREEVDQQINLQRRKVVAWNCQWNGSGFLVASNMYLPKFVVNNRERHNQLRRTRTNAMPPAPPPSAEEVTREMWESGVVVTSAAGGLRQMEFVLCDT
jgi:hypothetical protein